VIGAVTRTMSSMPQWRRFVPTLRRRDLATALRRPALVVNVVLGVLVLAGAFLAYRTVAVADTTSTASTAGGRFVPVTQGPVTSSVTASGTVQSAATANANFLTSGTVTEIDAHVGDAVKAGQVLAKVGATASQEQLDTARANLSAARSSLTRANAASPVDAATVAAAQAQVTQAQNSVNAAQRALDGTVLTAPMDGTVTAVNGIVGGSSSGGSSGAGSSGGGGSSSNAGNGGGGTGGAGGASSAASSSGSGTGFVQLADLTKMQVSAYFAEADATKLKTGQAATVGWSALSGARATGKVATIAPTATTQNNVNSYLVTISLDTLPDGIRIGQTTTVGVVVAASADDAVRVPVAAVQSFGNRHTVNVVGPDGKTTQPRQVEVGVQGDQFVEITSGLDPGERVALNTSTTNGGTTTGRGGFGGGGFGGGGFGGGGFGGGGAGGNRGGGGATNGGGGTRGGG
jgi:macrolide-specific efflux system membrane fusion protein